MKTEVMATTPRVTQPERNEVLQEFEEKLPEGFSPSFFELQNVMQRREPEGQGGRGVFLCFRFFGQTKK